MLPKLHQVGEPHGVQILHQLLQLRLLEQTKGISINALHLNDRRLPLLDKLAVENGLIVIKVKGVPEMVLKPEILLVLSMQISTSHGLDFPDMVMVVNWPGRGPNASRIRS